MEEVRKEVPGAALEFLQVLPLHRDVWLLPRMTTSNHRKASTERGPGWEALGQRARSL